MVKLKRRDISGLSEAIRDSCHREKAKFFFKTFREIRSAGKARIKGYLGNIMVMCFP